MASLPDSRASLQAYVALVFLAPCETCRMATTAKSIRGLSLLYGIIRNPSAVKTNRFEHSASSQNRPATGEPYQVRLNHIQYLSMAPNRTFFHRRNFRSTSGTRSL
jgi:hypothetical protein